jgi:hypothetical protein
MCLKLLDGRVAEWFKAPVLKTGEGASLPWVRIPPCPPVKPNLSFELRHLTFLGLFYPQSYPLPGMAGWSLEAFRVRSRHYAGCHRHRTLGLLVCAA